MNIKDIQDKIKETYEKSITIEQAEEFAAELLYTQMLLSSQIKKADLDRRMKRTGLKSIRAALRLEIASKGEKKPTEATIDAMVDSNELYVGEQNRFDEAEVNTEELERIFNIIKEAHIYYRGVAKGRFE